MVISNENFIMMADCPMLDEVSGSPIAVSNEPEGL
jgi:hypothetical protein